MQKIGFSDKEAAVYIASLELGPATILELAKKSKVNRATTYVVIEALIKKGLALSFEKGKKRYFSVESPECLLSIFNIRKKEIDEQEREFSAFLPELKKIYSSGLTEGKPVVRFFEGKEGIKAIQDDIIKTKTEILREFTSLDDAYDFFPPSPKDHRKKINKNVKLVKTIYTSKKGPILPVRMPDRKGPFITKFVPPSQFPFFCDMAIYENKIALVAFKGKLLGVVIENEQIAKTMSSIFELAWSGRTD